MFFSSKRPCAARDTSAKSRGQRAVFSAIEALEMRTMMSTVTYTVLTNSDSVASIVTPSGANAYTANTLRAAVTNANNQSFPVVIKFASALAGKTITLTKGLTLGPVAPAGTHAYTFTGLTGSNVTISGAGKYTIFTIAAGVSATFDPLTLAHGLGAEGGAIDSAGPLTLIGDTFASNTAGGGGAVYSATGQVSATNCTFIGNTAEEGGAVYITNLHAGAADTFTGDTFTGNYAAGGGAIVIVSGVTCTFTVATSTFTGNSATDIGGAILGEAEAGSLTTSINGSSFTGNSAVDEGGAIVSAGAGSVTLANDTLNSNKATDGVGGAVVTEDDALVVNSSTFKSDSAYGPGGAIVSKQLGGNPSVNITGSTFSNDASLDASGGAIYSDQNNTAIVNSSLTGNTAFTIGGAVDSEGTSSSTLTLVNDNISNDTSTEAGGGVVTTDNAVVVSATSFTHDKSDVGGGLATGETAALSVTSSLFSDDASYDEGGGLYFDPLAGSATVTNTTFSDDTSNSAAEGEGGGIYAEGASLTAAGDTFTGDTSSENGGGIFSEVVTLTVTNGVFTGNTAAVGGGGISTTGNTTDTITGSTFTGNSAIEEDGGAIAAGADTTNLDNDVLTGNTAGEFGGAVFCESEDLYASQDTFSGNTALISGGGLYDSTLGSQVFDSTFSGNVATVSDGGGVYVQSIGSSYANDTFYGNTAGSEGGGMYLDSAGAVVTDCTIDGNSAAYGKGGGIHNHEGALLDGDIVAGNFVTGTPGTGNDLNGVFIKASTDDLIGDGSNQTGFTEGEFGGNFVGSSFAPIDPLLGALANNGGPTETQIPASTSLAIGNSADFPVLDASSNDVTLYDQTGLNLRPQSQGYDIGAYQTDAEV